MLTNPIRVSEFFIPYSIFKTNKILIKTLPERVAFYFYESIIILE